jgi:plastocyanin
VRVASRALLLGSLLVAVGACSAGPPPVEALASEVGPVTDEPAIAVADDLFEPTELVVEVGTEVTWTWEGRRGHDVVGDGFRSSVQTTGTFAHTFERSGTYRYVCSLHPRMAGAVHVVP